MNNPFLYPGRGKTLRRVTGSTGNTIFAPETTTIPNGGFSELIAAHDARELMFEFVFDAAATGDVLIEKVFDQTASVAGETFATKTVAASRSANWNAVNALVGFFRIQNTSGQSLTVYCQKRIS